MDTKADALLCLGRMLQSAGYTFVTVTPETHRRVNERAPLEASSLRDVFGWSRPFARELLPTAMFELLERAAVLENVGSRYRSGVRFSTLGGNLLAHSCFPTIQRDAVFFGPDTYRFCALLKRWAPPAKRLLDLGCGSGAGAISIAERARQIVLSDINRKALELAAVNVELAGLSAEYRCGDVLESIDGLFDLVVVNPPYIRDLDARTYRDGGGRFGEAVGVHMVREALARLRRGGTLIVYTGSAIIAGEDTFYASVQPALGARDLQVTYEELDPDVFGEELAAPQYVGVDRIAAVGLCVRVN